MKTKPKSEDLSRRERQIMNELYRLEKASASEIREALSDPPAYNTVRTLLTILQEKGHVRAKSDGTRLIYRPVVPREEMAQSAIRNVIDTFFGGSVERVVSTLLTSKETQVSQEELARLAEAIERARAEAV